MSGSPKKNVIEHSERQRRALRAMGLTLVCGLVALWGGGRNAHASDGLSSYGLVALTPTDSGAITASGNGTLEVSQIYVNSSSTSAVTASGNALFDTSSLHIVGGAKFSGNAACLGSVSTGSPAYADPFSSLSIPSGKGMPDLNKCSMSGGSKTINPGFYPGGISLSGKSDLTLLPGVYVIGGGLSISGQAQMEGKGVTLVISTGGVSMSGTGDVELSPPESGSLAGMVLIQPAANTSGLSLSGGANFQMHGHLYAPKAVLTLSGNSVADGDGPQFGTSVVAASVTISGNGLIKIGAGDMKSVSPPKPDGLAD
jgi:hypothetical protein